MKNLRALKVACVRAALLLVLLQSQTRGAVRH